MSLPLDAETSLKTLELEPHPEGGYFRRVYRHAPPGGARGDASSIYFLVTAESPSRWHRILDATEVWYFHAGAALELSVLSGDGERVSHRLGLDLAAGERPQAVVPAGCWQSARTLGSWTLVGCGVAPAFDLASWELAPWELTPGEFSPPA